MAGVAGDYRRQKYSMNVLLWRGWRPAFDEGVTYTTLHGRGIGGTEMQMLWHAQHLAAAGHRVQILGATCGDVLERGVDFIGASDQADQAAAISGGRVSPPDLILLEGAYHAACSLRECFPGAVIVHVGQNIDANSDRAAFAQARYIDLYAFVGLGHFADYCARWPQLRHKFIVLRNAVPWQEFHGRVPRMDIEDKVTWVGSWTKKGLRTWCKVMEEVFPRRPNLSWLLCGPAYESAEPAMPRHLMRGLDLPRNRISCTTLPLPALLREIAASRVVLVSFGNECGPGSILDAHAMARPTISGNDMVYKFANPEGTGLRASTVAEARGCLEFLLDQPAIADAFGQAGRRLVLDEYHEDRQKNDLDRLVAYVASGVVPHPITLNPACHRWQEQLEDLCERGARWWRKVRVKS